MQEGNSAGALACGLVGRRVDVEQLVGSNEIAERLGLRHPQHVHRFRVHDPTFPDPVATIGSPRIPTFVWYWPDVERWARKKGRLPPKQRRSPGGAQGGQPDQEGTRGV